YTAQHGTLSWAAGDAASKTFSIPILNDTLVEGDETVGLVISAPGGGATLASPSTATLTIKDADQPISDPSIIVFQHSPDGNNLDIYSMNPDGTGVTRLTTNPNADAIPEFSLDGTKIVFASNRDGNFEIYSMNTNGSNQTRLTNNPGFD